MEDRMTRNFTSRVSRFELKFIFRYTRVLPLLAAAVAVILLVVAVAALTYSFAPVMKARTPVAAPEPPAVALTFEQVHAHVQAREQPAPTFVRTAPPVRPPAAASVTPPSADAVAIAEGIHEFRQWATERKLAWVDRTERYCRQQNYWGTCTQWATRTVERGAGTFLLNVLADYNHGPREEVVELGEAAAYRVNSSNAPEKRLVLGELNGMTAAIPTGEEWPMVDAWAALRRQLEQARHLAIVQEQERVARLEAENEAAYFAKQQSRTELRESSTRAFLSALAALFVAGLLLIIIAIERNTRTLQALLASPAPYRQRAEAPPPLVTAGPG
jgi:hypothetical protein